MTSQLLFKAFASNVTKAKFRRKNEIFDRVYVQFIIKSIADLIPCTEFGFRFFILFYEA